jgi:hypothetical protein
MLGTNAKKLGISPGLILILSSIVSSSLYWMIVIPQGRSEIYRSRRQSSPRIYWRTTRSSSRTVLPPLLWNSMVVS